MRNFLFSSILQVSPNNDYFVELKELAQPLPDTLVNGYKKALEGVKDVSPETKSFLEDFTSFIDLASSTLIPLSFIVYRIIAERPWELFKSTKPSDEVNRTLISTYGELYDILQCYKPESAIRLLEFISSNSSLRSAIISAYKESDRATFCKALENSGENHSDYLNRIYILTCRYDGIDLFMEKFSSLKRGKVSLEDFIDSDDVEDALEAPSLEQIAKHFSGKSNGLNFISENIAPLKPIISSLDNVESDNFESYLIYLASLIEKLDIDSLNDSIEFVCYFWTYSILDYYNDIKEGLFSEESNVIDNLIWNSNYEEFICDVYEDVRQEYSEDGNKIVPQEINDQNHSEEKEMFLPLDFYEKKNRRQGETECIANLKTKFIESGVSSLCAIIDFVAEHDYIENTVEQKRNFAFRLTGFHPDYALPEKMHWYKDTNILSFLIQRIYYRGDWNNARRLIETDKTLYNSSELKRTSFEEQKFKTLFEELFPGL